MRLAAGASEPTTLASGLENGSALATDGAEVYFVDRTMQGGVVKRVAASGGPITTLISCLGVSLSVSSSDAIELDDDAVYFTANDKVYRANRVH